MPFSTRRFIERSQRLIGATRSELMVAFTLLSLSLVSLAYHWLRQPEDPFNLKLKARIAAVVDSLSRLDSLRTTEDSLQVASLGFVPGEGDAEEDLIDSVPPIKAPSGYKHKRGPSNRLDLCRCSEDELQQIPGIGPSLARRIVLYRSHHPFFQLEQLRDVKGIGSVLYKKITPWLRLERVQNPKALTRKP